MRVACSPLHIAQCESNPDSQTYEPETDIERPESRDQDSKNDQSTPDEHASKELLAEKPHPDSNAAMLMPSSGKRKYRNMGSRGENLPHQRRGIGSFMHPARNGRVSQRDDRQPIAVPICV